MIDPLTFAIVKHHGQLRRGLDIPYIVHPIEVYRTLKECGYAENICIAGLFHDLLEDTKTEPEEIVAVAGNSVLDIVKEVSENYAGKFDFKAEHDPFSFAVKCADTLSNMNDWIRGNKVVSKTKIASYRDNLTYAISKKDFNPSLKSKIEISLKALVI